METKEWRFSSPKTETEYLISTSRHLLSIDFVREAFATDDMPWTTVPSLEDTKTMLDNSLTLGVYVTETSDTHDDAKQLRQIGMARLITDYVTMSYLTDVYIAPAHRGNGLSRFMMSDCVADIMGSLSNHRRSILLTSAGPKLREMYTETLGLRLLTNDGHLMVMTGKPERKVVDGA